MILRTLLATSVGSYCFLSCVAVQMSHQLIFKVPCISPVHFVRFLLLPLPSVSLNIKSFSVESDAHTSPKYFNLLITAKVSRECLGLIWFITDSFVILDDYGILSDVL